MRDGRAFRALHHVGVSVRDIDASITFWQRLLGAEPRLRRVLEGPRLPALVGYPAARIDSCWLDLPGGVALELLRYLEPEEPPYDPGTAHPGNVHLCFLVDDLDEAHRHALACGASAVSSAPVEVAGGQEAGLRIAYLRDPDGVTLELRQPPGARRPSPP